MRRSAWRCSVPPRAAGVTAQLEVHEAMSRAEYAYVFDSAESKIVFDEIAMFFDHHLER